MRLEKIKLAGFKSFVDPTTVHFPSNLVGIVGPNGCGKSNVIDAVRWVMGESSAKMLRGESMADVIFNGSSTRKPVGMASIELIFDNCDGSAGGQYAQYAQISVKRQVSRDGQSQYLLNGVRCRRRDITDLFLGTGLGPRSYSIIEQGMISRIIEARPEELRVYLEEAAWISKYKERRRETGNRIRHTRENLERLDDVREEVQKQLRHLERQAATAKRYKTLKDEERRVRAELLALRLSSMQEDVVQRNRRISELEIALEAAIARQREVEAEIEQQREAHGAANEHFNEAQGRFYAIGSRIARLEEAIQYARESRRQQEVDLQQAERALAEACELGQQDQRRLQRLVGELERDRPCLEEARMVEEAAREQLAAAEEAMAAWQVEWDHFSEQVNEPAQQAQVERTRINYFEQQEQQLRRRIERNQDEQRRLSNIELEAEIRELLRREEEAGVALADVREQTGQAREDIEQARADIQQRQDMLDRLRSELQTFQGRMASLQALQQAARGEDDEAFNEWLSWQGLEGARRLFEDIEVDGRWQQAVEVALGQHLQAVLVDDLSAHADDVEALLAAGARLFENRAGQVVARPGTLASVVRGPMGPIGILDSIYLADDLAQAMVRRGELGADESLITSEGVLLGNGWLVAARGNEAERGMLAREREIHELSERERELAPCIDDLECLLVEARERLRQAERTREDAQARQDAGARALADIKALLSGNQARAEQIRQRLIGLEEEATELKLQLQEGSEQIEVAREGLHAALERVAELERRRESLQAERECQRLRLEEVRQTASVRHAEVHELALRIESIRSTGDSLRSSIDRVHSQVTQLDQRVAGLREVLEQSKAPMGEQQIQLETQLRERVAAEARLVEARKVLEGIDHRLRELEQSRHGVEQQVQGARITLDQARMARQEIVVRAGTLREQLGETGFEFGVLFEAMPEDANVQVWQERAGQLTARIQRLGPINLAAIDEFREQSERMEYLDRQHADVSKSLETLEEAIRKIDRETRTRFKETFDKVDTGFKDLFPKLFGGGHAYLELTGDDLLDTGVTVMACPPGKRNSSIHLLSGGEKALTAVALVFSIFRLNPAPFCMLDEVDAPLDDANVGRYSQLVEEMSEYVQFIFITHNKVTMEIANQLMGVTMHEPGVSRLVSVDVEEAASLAAV